MARRYRKQPVGIGIIAGLCGISPQAVWKAGDQRLLIDRHVRKELERVIARLNPARQLPWPKFQAMLHAGFASISKRAGAVLTADAAAKHKQTTDRLIHGLASLLGVPVAATAMAVWKSYIVKVATAVATLLKMTVGKTKLVWQWRKLLPLPAMRYITARHVEILALGRQKRALAFGPWAGFDFG